MKLLAEFQKYNFFRTTDWRWQRVLKMVDRYGQPGRCTKRDDEFIRKARAFALKWRHLDTDEEREELWWANPGLYYAYELFEKKTVEPHGAAFLEARLLAGQDPAVIAKCLSTIKDTVLWYEALFFNVSEYLVNRDWVTARVLLPAFMLHQGTWQEGTTEVVQPFRDDTVSRPFLDASLKFFAYFGGPHLVDFMITGFQQGKPLASPDDLSSWLDASVASSIRRQTAQAALQFKVTKWNVMELFTVHNAIVTAERSEENSDRQKTTTERHIKAMVDEIPWAVGASGEKAARGTLLGAMDKMSAELRDDEVLKIAAGEPVPSIKDNFPDKLPAPRRKTSVLLGYKEGEL